MKTYVLITALLFGACAHGKATCPEQGGPVFVQANTPHFELITDLDQQDTIELASQLEQMYNAFVDLAFKSDDPPEDVIRVVLFTRQDDFQDPKHSKRSKLLGFFTEDRLDQRPTMVMTGDFDQATREVFQHEMTHLFVRHHLPQAPRWLNEGTAKFWETLTFDGKHAWIGKPMSCSMVLGRDALSESKGCHPSMWMSGGRLPKVETVVSAAPERFYEKKNIGEFYAASWALVHVLMGGTEIPSQKFDRFREQLTQGRDPALAWNELAAGADLGSLNERVRGYFVNAQIPVWKLDYTPKALGQPIARTLTPGEAHLVHARWGARSAKERAIPEIDEALRHAPESTDAHLMRAVYARTASDTPTAERELAKALELSPEDPRVLYLKLRWLTSSSTATDHQEAGKVVERLIKVAKSPNALNAIAWYYAERGETDRGFPFAMRALDKEPGCWECIDTLALLVHQKGDHVNAVELQKRALNLIPDFRPPPEDMFERLRRYLSAAQKSPPSP